MRLGIKRLHNVQFVWLQILLTKHDDGDEIGNLQQISLKSSKQISRLLPSWSVLVLARGQKAQLPTQVPAARLDYNYHEHYKANTNCQVLLVTVTGVQKIYFFRN